MDKLAPWQRLLALIEPHYPKKGNGRPPINMQTMLRVYCLQQWYNLSDPGVEEALYDMESMQRRFAHIELIDDAIPDETTILNFRRIIEKHQLSVKILAVVNEYCMENNITISQGSMVDAYSTASSNLHLQSSAIAIKIKRKPVILKCIKQGKAISGILA